MARDDLPVWWRWPERCGKGHPWGPGRILAGNHPCDCPAARVNFNRHLYVRCDPPGGRCDETWFDPPCAYSPGDQQVISS